MGWASAAAACADGGAKADDPDEASAERSNGEDVDAGADEQAASSTATKASRITWNTDRLCLVSDRDAGSPA